MQVRAGHRPRVPKTALVPPWQQQHQTRCADADLGWVGGDGGRGGDADRHRPSGSRSPASKPCSHMCMKHFSRAHRTGQPQLVHAQGYKAASSQQGLVA